MGNHIADKLLSNAGFGKAVSEGKIVVTTEVKMIPTDKMHSEFDKVPFSKISEFGNKVKSLGKCPKDIIGNEDGIHFRKINMDDCEKIIEMGGGNGYERRI